MYVFTELYYLIRKINVIPKVISLFIKISYFDSRPLDVQNKFYQCKLEDVLNMKDSQ